MECRRISRGILMAVMLFLAASCLMAVDGAVVLNADLTKGPAGLPDRTRVIGGQWRDGWQATDNGQRIVFDPGYWIKNGRMEVTFTRWDISNHPVAFALPEWDRIAKLISIYELEQLGDPDAPIGDSFRVQVGDGERARNLQGVLRANTKESERSWRWMQEYGQWSDWTVDDRTPMTMIFEWRAGKGTFTDIKGKSWPCAKECMNQMDNLRFLVLGNDASCAGSPLGVRFLSAKLVDLDRSATADVAPIRKRTVFDVDLTKGPAALPAQSVVLGGEWTEGGWRVTGNHQRIVMDPGYHLRNGILEVTMTRKRAPQRGQKMNIVGIYEDPHIDQADDHGDIFYLRLGMSELASHQGNVKAFIREGPQDRGKEDGMMVWEQRFGKGEDWILDDKTPRTMKFRWQEGVGYLTEFGGTELACPSNCDNKLDRLRYVVLGGDRYDNGASLVGLRFLSAKLIDLDVPEK